MNNEISFAHKNTVGWSYNCINIPHLGHLSGLLELAKNLKQGKKIKILLKDVNYNSKNFLVSEYEKIKQFIINFIINLGLNSHHVTFYKTSSIRFNEEFVHDFYKMTSVTSESEVNDIFCKNTNIKIFDIFNVLINILDIYYLDVNEIISNDIKKIELSKKLLSELQYKNFSIIEHDSIYNFKNSLMCNNENLTCITITEKENIVRKKINKYFCEEGNGNTVILTIFKSIIFPYCNLTSTDVVVNRNQKNTIYETYKDIKLDFLNKELHPGDLKKCCADYVLKIFMMQKFK